MKKPPFNRAVVLEVEAPNPEDLVLLAGLSPKAKATDNWGNVATEPESPYSNLSNLFGQTKGEEHRETVLLNLPDKRATSLKTLEGNLLVMNGKIRDFSFPLDSLKGHAEQTKGKVSVHIEDSAQTEREVKFTISYKMPDLAPPAKASSIQLMQFLQQRAFGVRLELLDTSGKRVGGILWGYHGMGGTASGGKGGWDRIAMSVITKNDKTTYTYGFARGIKVRPATIHVTVVERVGPDKSIPFKLTNIPLIN